MQFNNPFKDIKPRFQGIHFPSGDHGQTACSGYMYFPGQNYQCSDIGGCRSWCCHSCGGYMLPSSLGLNMSTTAITKSSNNNYLTNSDPSSTPTSNERSSFFEDTTLAAANFYPSPSFADRQAAHPIVQYSYPQQVNSTTNSIIEGVPSGFPQLPIFPRQQEFESSAATLNTVRPTLGYFPPAKSSLVESVEQLRVQQPFQLQKIKNSILPQSSKPPVAGVSNVTDQISIDSSRSHSRNIEIRSNFVVTSCSSQSACVTPEVKKNIAYQEKRKKNNESAKRSRLSRKEKEKSMAALVLQLEHENGHLRAAISATVAEMNRFRNELSIIGIS